MKANGNGRPPDDEPPSNPDAERGLLASLMALPEAMDHPAVVAVQPGDFFDPSYRAIHRHLVGAHLAGQTPEVLPARLSAAGDYTDDVRAVLMEIISTRASGSDAAHYAELVRESAQQRKLWQFSRELAGQIKDRLPPEDIRGFVEAFLECQPAKKMGARKMSDQLANHKGMRRPVLHGLLREGETLNIIAPAKTGKSWLTYDLALSVVTGRRWLDTFLPVPGRVLIVDNELHQETLCDRIPRVAHALGLTDGQWSDQLETMILRGRLKDIHKLAADELGNIVPGYYKLVIIDALYRVLPSGCDENNNSNMAAVYNTVDHLAAQLQCAFVLIHHSTKGSQSAKAVTDVGAGAGSASRAADTHFILRQHEQPGAVVADGVTRSWSPIEPFCLRWEWPLWKRDDRLDPALLKPDKPRRERPKAEPDAQPKDPPWTAERFAAELASEQPQPGDALIEAAVLAGVSELKAGKLLKRAVATGKLYPWKSTTDRRVKLYATIKPPDDPPPSRGTLLMRNNIYIHTPHTPQSLSGKSRGSGSGGMRDNTSRQRRLRFKASQQPKEPCRECGLTLLSCGASGLCWECADAAWQAGRTAEQPARRPVNEPDGD